ncbi:MAG: DNA-binding response regulator [Acidobacteria bacterium]|nr:MAG: DNA-binding response regulator [Acidobacteriota bacterium]
MIRTLIADTDPLARDRLASLLAAERDVEILGQCGDGEEAVAAIGTLKPDLVFLDVQLPRMNGFEVIEAVAPEHRPLVVFVTAFDGHALRAFEVRALDYLLKPFDRGRFSEALQRARRELEIRANGDIGRRLLALARDERAGRQTDRFLVKSGGRLFVVRTEDIEWIEAAGNYVRLHAGGATHLVRETMASIESRLDPHRFLRIHRSRIVNLQRVQELQPWVNGEYAVILQTGTRLALSRGCRERLQKRVAAS